MKYLKWLILYPLGALFGLALLGAMIGDPKPLPKTTMAKAPEDRLVIRGAQFSRTSARRLGNMIEVRGRATNQSDYALRSITITCFITNKNGEDTDAHPVTVDIDLPKRGATAIVEPFLIGPTSSGTGADCTSMVAHR